MHREVFVIPTMQFSVFEDDDGQVRWLGKFRNSKVNFAAPIDGGAKCILLIEPEEYSWAVAKNLICVDRDGGLVWAATPPDGADCFTDVRLTPEGISAHTWSCYKVKLDSQTGRITASEFTK